MKKIFLIIVLIGLTNVLVAQPYYPTIDSIAIINQPVNECDSICIRIKGTSNCSPFTLDHINYTQTANSIKLDVYFFFDTVTNAIFEEYDDTVKIGRLTPGSYNLTCVSFSNRIYNFYMPQDTAYLSFNVNAANILSTSETDTSFCPDNTILLNSKDTGNSYLWSTGDTTQYIEVANEDIYWVEIINDNCTKIIDSFNVKLLPAPIINLPKDTNFCTETIQSIILDPGLFASYHWLPTNDTSRLITVNESGIYHVTVLNEEGCSASDSINVKEICDARIWIPNAFTPNADGNNDVFKAEGMDITRFEMYIYDRWGELLYKTEDMDKGWNGIVQGSLCRDGVYVWLINYKGISSPEKILTGHVILLH